MTNFEEEIELTNEYTIEEKSAPIAENIEMLEVFETEEMIDIPKETTKDDIHKDLSILEIIEEGENSDKMIKMISDKDTNTEQTIKIPKEMAEVEDQLYTPNM